MAYTSGAIFEKKIMKHPVFSVQIIYNQIDQMYK